MLKYATLLAGLLLAAPAFGQDPAADYPKRTVRIVVCVPAGGGVDTVTRIIADKLPKFLGQPVVVENKGGQSGNLGAEFVYSSDPDGYTLLASQPAPITTAPLLFKKLNFDPTKFEPVAVMSAIANTLLVRPDFPANNVKEFIAYAKANPGKLKYGSSGIGTSIHLTSELFRNAAGVDLTHIPYKGAAPALTDLLGGQIDLMFPGITPVVAHVKSGKLRAIGLTSLKRSPALPDLPTMHELGVANFQSIGWYGVLVPTGTPKPLVARLNGELVAALGQPDLRERLASQGGDAVSSTPEQFAAFIADEMKKWTNVIRTANIQVE